MGFGERVGLPELLPELSISLMLAAHQAKAGKVVRADGTPFSGPLQAPACGNYIWAMTAALATDPQQHSNVWGQDPAPLGMA